MATAFSTRPRREGVNLNSIRKLALAAPAVVLTASFALASVARAEVVNVDATANIFGAGHTLAPAPGGGSPGILPPFVSFAAGSGVSFTIASIFGSISLSPDAPNNGNGTSRYGSTDLSSFGGISGIVDARLAGFLVGVFLDDREPSGLAPSRLFFNTPDDFTNLSPLLQQTFLIGDGVNDTNGAIQTFFIPAGATRLFLGFADGFDYRGLPGQYQDNSGALAVDVRIVSVPEPSILGLLIAGLVGVVGLQRHRQRRTTTTNVA